MNWYCTLKKELLRRAEKNLSSEFANSPIPAPAADEPTRRVGCDVCCVGQFFISNREFDATRNSMANAWGVSQDEVG